MFEHINVDIAFLSVTAIDYDAGITADDVNESAISRTILERCGRKKIGIIRSEKFNKSSFFNDKMLMLFIMRLESESQNCP
jgi:DeoR/GlpR family transcriptional regulator of sugar metabolism